MNILQREYEFYKGLSEKLEFRQNDELATLERQVRFLVESEKDNKLKLQMAESDCEESKSRERKISSELGRAQRDLKSLVAVNEEYQEQALQFKDREEQYASLSKEYREKLETIKFERERIALKEEQFFRQVQKAESQAKADSRRMTEKHDS